MGLIQKRLLTAQSRQKSYVDRRRRPLEFEVGDHVFLKVIPNKGVVRFLQAGKAIAEVYRALRDTREGGHSFVSIGITVELIMCL